MGLFDYITCAIPLEHCPEWAKEFQTKDTPAQLMEHYRIMEDGTLWVATDNADEFVDFDGRIDFYTNNVAGRHGSLVLLEGGTGKVYISVEYRCVFIDGQVVKGPILTHREVVETDIFTDPAAYDAASAKLRAEREEEFRASGMSWQDFIMSRITKET